MNSDQEMEMILRLIAGQEALTEQSDVAAERSARVAPQADFSREHLPGYTGVLYVAGPNYEVEIRRGKPRRT